MVLTADSALFAVMRSALSGAGSFETSGVGWLRSSHLAVRCPPLTLNPLVTISKLALAPNRHPRESGDPVVQIVSRPEAHPIDRFEIVSYSGMKDSPGMGTLDARRSWFVLSNAEATAALCCGCNAEESYGILLPNPRALQ